MDSAFNTYESPAAQYAMAETIVYNPSESSAVSCLAVVKRETRRRVEDESEQGYHEAMEIEVPVATVATPVDLMAATGNSVDQCTIDGKTWEVRKVLERGATGGWHLLQLFDKLLPR